MQKLARVLPQFAFAAGAALFGYGGYGTGIGHVAGAELSHWVQVAALFAAGIGLFGFGVWKERRRDDAEPSVVADFLALERLVPTVRRHPEGLDTLHDLLDVVFESCHRPEMLKNQNTLAERGGRRHA